MSSIAFVKVAPNTTRGTVLKYDSVNQYWNVANSNDAALLGVSYEDAYQPPLDPNDPNAGLADFWICRVIFSGLVSATASRDIPSEGGFISIENGQVFVDLSSNHCGIIQPNAYDQPPVLAGEQVVIHLR